MTIALSCLLAPNTVELAQKIDRFNPDKTWTPVAEEQFL